MKEYPDYKKGELQLIFDKLPKKEKEIINDFVKYVGISSNARTRLENNKRTLVQFRHITNKSLDNISLEDLRNYLELLNKSDRTQSSRNDLKASIKRFLRWYYPNWSKRFAELKDIKLIMKINEEKINAGTLLKKEEIEALIKSEPKLYWKTFLITLYESGLRPIELRTIRWKNVKLNYKGDFSSINVYATKTSKAREVYVKEATKFLKEWKQRQELQEVKNDLIFPATQDPDKPIGKSIVSEWLKKLSKKVLNREVNPYLLRHTRATELYINAGIPDKTAQKFLGHTKSMSDVYTHLSSKDVQEAMEKTIYETEELSPEKKHELEKKIEELQKKFDFVSRDRGGWIDRVMLMEKEIKILKKAKK